VRSSVRPFTPVSCIMAAGLVRLTSSRVALHQRGRSAQQRCGDYVGDNYVGSVHYVVQQNPFQMASPLSRVSRHFVMPCLQRQARFCIVQLPATKISRNIWRSRIRTRQVCSTGTASMSPRKLQIAVFFVEHGCFRWPGCSALERIESVWISYKVWPPVVALVRIFTVVNMVDVAFLSALGRSCDSMGGRAGSRNLNTSRTFILSRGNARAARLAASTMAVRCSAGPCRRSRAWSGPVFLRLMAVDVENPP
jgi:hypothetical protein